MEAAIFSASAIVGASGVLVFLMAYFFAIVMAFGVSTKWGIASLLVPFLAFVVCYRRGGDALFPVKMGAGGLLLAGFLAVPAYYLPKILGH